MTIKKEYKTFDHDLHARSVAPEDFWRQIRRTVNGRPVSEEQIHAIVSAIDSALALQAGDVLLDLACGNGALTARLRDRVSGFLGVDSSEFLISVAKKHFESLPERCFLLSDAAEYLAREPAPDRFTKVLCYGSFPYFSSETAVDCLRLLAARFRSVERVFIGNLPDRDRRNSFYTSTPPGEGELDDPRSQVGIWRSKEEFLSLARDCGWAVAFREMPASFYAAHYRFDALLTRQ